MVTFLHAPLRRLATPPLEEWRSLLAKGNMFILIFLILYFYIFEFLLDCIYDTLQVFPNQSVFKTNDPNSIFIQKRSSNVILSCTLKCVVPFSIELNTQFSFRTIKIQYIITDRMLLSPFTAIQSLCFKLRPKYRFFRGKIPPQILSPYQQFFFITYCISHNVSVFASILCVYCYTLPSGLRPPPLKEWRSLFAFAFHPSSHTLMKQGGSALQGRGGIKLWLRFFPLCFPLPSVALRHLPSKSGGACCFCISFQLSHLDVTRGECPARARGN